MSNHPGTGEEEMTMTHLIHVAFVRVRHAALGGGLAILAAAVVLSGLAVAQGPETTPTMAGNLRVS